MLTNISAWVRTEPDVTPTERVPAAARRDPAAFAAVLRQTLLGGAKGQAGQSAVTLALLALDNLTLPEAPYAAPPPPNPLVRVSQTDPAEYHNASQARVWGGSTCSAASLTAVARSRGIPVRIADVMAAMPGGLTPELGLLSRSALSGAASRLGLATADDVTTYAALESATRRGEPVLVDIYDARFTEGHWLTVTSAGPKEVQVLDSSGYNLKSIPREEFLAAWRGRGMRVLGNAEAPLGRTVS